MVPHKTLLQLVAIVSPLEDVVGELDSVASTGDVCASDLSIDSSSNTPFLPIIV